MRDRDDHRHQRGPEQQLHRRPERMLDHGRHAQSCVRSLVPRLPCTKCVSQSHHCTISGWSRPSALVCSARSALRVALCRGTSRADRTIHADTEPEREEATRRAVPGSSRGPAARDVLQHRARSATCLTPHCSMFQNMPSIGLSVIGPTTFLLQIEDVGQRVERQRHVVVGQDVVGLLRRPPCGRCRRGCVSTMRICTSAAGTLA